MKRLLALLLALLPAAAQAATPPAEAQPMLVFAAASLTDALPDIQTLWLAAGHKPLKFSFAASSTLAQHHGIIPGTRQDITGNSLVLVEPKDGLKPITLTQGVSLDPLLGAGGRLAVGDPAHVPAGIYAQQSLQKLGLWPALQNRLAPADSVRSALRLVEVHEAPAGIVYATDVKASPSLAIAGIFPAASHDPIRYPAAVVTDTAEARAFLQFLSAQGAQDVFEHYGFVRP